MLTGYGISIWQRPELQEDVTPFPENVTWFPKMNDKLYDKKVLGILIGDQDS